MTPTPTDPREEKQMRPCEHRSDGLCGECLAVLNKYILEDEALTDRRITSLESTNSKLAAEIAEFRAELTRADDKIIQQSGELNTLRAELEAMNQKVRDADFERIGAVNAIKRNSESFEAMKAELEAARKERDRAVRFATQCESRDAAFEKRFNEELTKIAAILADEKQLEEGISDTAKRIRDQRDTALAAKDAAEAKLLLLDRSFEGHVYVENSEYDRLCAAEKRVAGLEDVLRFVRDECDWERGDSDQPFGGGDGRIGPAITAALTPAPTQEPPAGKLPIGTKIRFLKTLDAAPTGEHPYLVYANKGETGEITGHNDREDYMVKTDRWPTPFGASLGDEFEPIPPALCDQP